MVLNYDEIIPTYDDVIVVLQVLVDELVHPDAHTHQPVGRHDGAYGHEAGDVPRYHGDRPA